MRCLHLGWNLMQENPLQGESNFGHPHFCLLDHLLKQLKKLH